MRWMKEWSTLYGYLDVRRSVIAIILPLLLKPYLLLLITATPPELSSLERSTHRKAGNSHFVTSNRLRGLSGRSMFPKGISPVKKWASVLRGNDTLTTSYFCVQSASKERKMHGEPALKVMVWVIVFA